MGQWRRQMTGDSLGRRDRTETGRESPPRLNPLFVEWLMGMPLGWTGFGPVGMEWFRWRRRMLSELSRLGFQKARVACDGTGVPSENHFVGSGNMVPIGSGAERSRDDWILSRYACYLMAMNGDPSKDEISHAQAYFAHQTRRQEQQQQLTAAERRLQLRNRVKEANKSLASAAKKAGVEKYPIFQDAGYKGLLPYGDHDDTCPAGSKCGCGLRVRRAELEASP